MRASVRAAVGGLSDSQLDTPYRDGGWSLRQVVHHVADSNINGYLRMKFAAAAEEPKILAYDEEVWAKFADATGPIEPSLALLHALHLRWVVFLRGLEEAAWERVFVHPQNGAQSLSNALELYAWHGQHHLAHVTETKKRLGW